MNTHFGHISLFYSLTHIINEFKKLQNHEENERMEEKIARGRDTTIMFFDVNLQLKKRGKKGSTKRWRVAQPKSS